MCSALVTLTIAMIIRRVTLCNKTWHRDHLFGGDHGRGKIISLKADLTIPPNLRKIIHLAVYKYINPTMQCMYRSDGRLHLDNFLHCRWGGSQRWASSGSGSESGRRKTKTSQTRSAISGPRRCRTATRRRPTPPQSSWPVESRPRTSSSRWTARRHKA